jgi:hypothetical protein
MRRPRSCMGRRPGPKGNDHNNAFSSPSTLSAPAQQHPALRADEDVRQTPSLADVPWLRRPDPWRKRGGRR